MANVKITPEALEKMVSWRKENSATWKQVAHHFKVNEGTLYSAYNAKYVKVKGTKTKPAPYIQTMSVPQKETKLVCLVGTPQDIAQALGAL